MLVYQSVIKWSQMCVWLFYRTFVSMDIWFTFVWWFSGLQLLTGKLIETLLTYVLFRGHSFIFGTVLYFGLSPPSNSHHQDYYIFSRGSEKHLHLSLLVGGGDNQNCTFFQILLLFRKLQQKYVHWGTSCQSVRNLSIKKASWTVGDFWGIYHLESRRRNSHVLVYHSPLLSHLLGVAACTFQMV